MDRARPESLGRARLRTSGPTAGSITTERDWPCKMAPFFRPESCTVSREFTPVSTQLLKNANTSAFWRRGFGFRRQNVRVNAILEIHVANILCFTILFGSPSLPRGAFWYFLQTAWFSTPGLPRELLRQPGQTLMTTKHDLAKNR